VSDEQSTLITGIGELVSHDGEGGSFARYYQRGAGLIAAGKVAWTGPGGARAARRRRGGGCGRAGRAARVSPTRTRNLVFAGERSAEFAARMGGPPRTGRAAILGTVEATRAASDAVLRANLRRLAAEMLRQGTTTFECKSGYGLTVADEAPRG